jgi:ParB-like chromosome segregation protein Spo0J
MKIEPRKLTDTRPYDNNPRQNDDAVAVVANSIREFGFRQPIVVDEAGVIICGHTRYKAAQQLGLEIVPVHMATDLTREQIRPYRLADNRTAEIDCPYCDVIADRFQRFTGVPAVLERTGELAMR